MRESLDSRKRERSNCAYAEGVESDSECKRETKRTRKVDLPRGKRRRCAASGRGRRGGGGRRSWREKEQGEVIISRYINIMI